MQSLDEVTAGESGYYLLNKNEPVARFHVNSELDAVVIDEVLQELPYWISNNLRIFIEHRRAPKQRENVQKLLELSGCDTIKGYLDITHALSLIDTFWVKPVDSKLDWEKVSLFSNPFNEVVARTAFEGGLHGRNLSTTSPEYGTDGSFAKCWVREMDKIKLLKRGSSGAANAGLEPYSEFYSSQIASKLATNSVDYRIRKFHGRICSECECFTTEEIGFVPYDALFPGNTDYLDVLEKMDGFGFQKEIREMFVVDAIIFNEDRHKNNFGFLIENATQKIVGMAPLFDHNISLLPYMMQDDLADLEAYLKPKGPRIGEDFYKIARYCLTPELRKKVINLKDFQFERDGKLDLPEWRLEFLEKFVQENVRKVLM